MTQRNRMEAHALQLTTFGTLGMALLGFGFAILTKSEAILLDGFYSLIGFAIALITQKVSYLITRPGNERYPFGYAVFEPMLNLSKGLLIALINLFAFISAMAAVWSGGRTIAAVLGLLYAGIAAIGCFILAWRVGSLAAQSGSSLAEVDAQNWMIDGFISFSVAAAFFVIQLAQGTPIASITPYADPVIVILLVLFTFSIPLKITRDAWRQIVGYRPAPDKVTVIENTIAEIFQRLEFVTWPVKSLEIGRFLYIQIYVLDLQGHCGELSQHDQYREQLYKSLAHHFEHFEVDVMFTRQHKWVQLNGASSTGIEQYRLS